MSPRRDGTNDQTRKDSATQLLICASLSFAIPFPISGMGMRVENCIPDLRERKIPGNSQENFIPIFGNGNENGKFNSQKEKNYLYSNLKNLRRLVGAQLSLRSSCRSQ